MKNIFFPTKDNNFYPHILKPISIGALLMALIIGKFMFLWSAPTNPSLASDLSLENIMSSINNERALRNVPVLNTDSRLTKAAQEKSDDMQKRHYFSHTDPEGNYVWDKIVAAGYSPYSTLGENLAIEFYNTESLVAAWMNSPTHRENVLNQNFQDQGMGLNLGDSTQGQYHSAITNTFGKLLNSPASKKSPAVRTTKKTAPQQPKPTPQTQGESIKQNPVATNSAPPAKTQNQANSLEEPLNVRMAYNPSQPTTTLIDQQTQNKISNFNENPDSNGVVGNKGNVFQKNLKLNIGFGIFLALLLLYDLKLFQKEKYPNLDKKLNNLSLLLLAILLVGILYWL